MIWNYETKSRHGASFVVTGGSSDDKVGLIPTVNYFYRRYFVYPTDACFRHLLICLIKPQHC